MFKRDISEFNKNGVIFYCDLQFSISKNEIKMSINFVLSDSFNLSSNFSEKLNKKTTSEKSRKIRKEKFKNIRKGKKNTSNKNLPS